VIRFRHRTHELRKSKLVVRSVRKEPAGDFDYEIGGQGYSSIRRPEPRFADEIRRALGDARSLINVGAGAGSYEPTDMDVTPIEPSASMRAQRPSHLTPAIDAVAEELPFADKVFDAALATVTIHQWRDLATGLAELRRVTRGNVVIMTFDPEELEKFWLGEFSPALMTYEAGRMPALAKVTELLGGTSHVKNLPIPFDCEDGFAESYFGRPEAFLDERVRRSQSAWGFLSNEDEIAAVRALQTGLDDGSWDARHGHLRRQHEYHGALRLITALP